MPQLRHHLQDVIVIAAIQQGVAGSHGGGQHAKRGAQQVTGPLCRRSNPFVPDAPAQGQVCKYDQPQLGGRGPQRAGGVHHLR
jgi:hypothetical protein